MTDFKEFSTELHERLGRPLDPEDIQVKIQTVSKDKKSALCVAYINSRTVQERFDEAVGCLGWNTEFSIIENKLPEQLRVECRITVRVKVAGDWLEVTKSDIGEGVASFKGDPNVAKTAYSDAFKRASVHWGIGRELYSLPKVYGKLDDRGRLASSEAVRREMLGKTTKKTQEKKTPRKSNPAGSQGQTKPKDDVLLASEAQKKYLTGLVKRVAGDNWASAGERLEDRPQFRAVVKDTLEKGEDWRELDYHEIRSAVLASITSEEAEVWLSKLKQIEEDQKQDDEPNNSEITTQEQANLENVDFED